MGYFHGFWCNPRCITRKMPHCYVSFCLPGVPPWPGFPHWPPLPDLPEIKGVIAGPADIISSLDFPAGYIAVGEDYEVYAIDKPGYIAGPETIISDFSFPAGYIAASQGYEIGWPFPSGYIAASGYYEIFPVSSNPSVSIFVSETYSVDWLTEFEKAPPYIAVAELCSVSFKKNGEAMPIFASETYSVDFVVLPSGPEYTFTLPIASSVYGVTTL